MAFIVEITHAPFGEPFVNKENLTEVTKFSSDGFTYLQLCTLIGQTVFHYGHVKISIYFEPKSQNSNINK